MEIDKIKVAKRSSDLLFVLEDDDSNDDHASDECQPQVDDQQTYVDWLCSWSDT